jgi:hypothetical protein
VLKVLFLLEQVPEVFEVWTLRRFPFDKLVSPEIDSNYIDSQVRSVGCIFSFTPVSQCSVAFVLCLAEAGLDCSTTGFDLWYWMSVCLHDGL